METYCERQVDRAERIVGYGVNHPLTPPNPRADVLFGQVTVVKLQMRDLGMNQAHGFGLFRGGASERAALARELEVTLRGIWETARALDPVQYPNAAEQFRLPRHPRHQQLIDYGHAFLGAIGPIKSVFVERAFAADFDEKLADKIASLDSAVESRNAGKQERRSGTAGLALAVKKLTAIVRELNAIMKTALRTTNPALLEVWKSASRVYSAPVSAPEPTPAPVPAALASADVKGASAAGAGAGPDASHADEASAPVQNRLNGNGAGSAVLIA